MGEMDWEGSVRRGDRGPKVKRVQEWLSLRGQHLAIDGDFGPATEKSVKKLQTAEGLEIDGVVGPITFGALVAPMKAATAPIAPGSAPLGSLVVQYAQQHLAQHPREVGGDNRGPWVRLYMNGNDGPTWRWCAGFVCFCMKQACDTLDAAMPIVASVSCDSLAASAKERGRFLAQPTVADRSRITPGSLFLVRRTSTDWIHTGIVVKAEGDGFVTIEGNTNDDGVSNGYEVCMRERGYGDKDFILI